MYLDYHNIFDKTLSAMKIIPYDTIQKEKVNVT